MEFLIGFLVLVLLALAMVYSTRRVVMNRASLRWKLALATTVGLLLISALTIGGGITLISVLYLFQYPNPNPSAAIVMFLGLAMILTGIWIVKICWNILYPSVNVRPNSHN